jgi:hypothetical protein
VAYFLDLGDLSKLSKSDERINKVSRPVREISNMRIQSIGATYVDCKSWGVTLPVIPPTYRRTELDMAASNTNEAIEKEG